MAAETLQNNALQNPAHKSNLLKSNALYQKVSPNFKQSGFQEPLAMVQGFILGLIARGHTSAESKTLELATSVLNSGEALSGSGIALFTTLLIESERALQQKELALFVPGKEEGAARARVQALVDLAYGFSLGFCSESQPIAGSIVQTNYQELNDELREHLDLIENLTQIDAASGASDQDIKLVHDTLAAAIVRLYELVTQPQS